MKQARRDKRKKAEVDLVCETPESRVARLEYNMSNAQQLNS